MKVGAENPKEAGSDLIVNAAAVKELYGVPAIVIDYGTATSYQLVLEDGKLDSEEKAKMKEDLKKQREEERAKRHASRKVD